MLRILLLTMAVFCTQCGQFGSQNLPDNETLKVDQVEKVKFCNMLEHPDDFVGREVQTTAILVATRFGAFIYEATCIDKEKAVNFEVDSSFASTKLARFWKGETSEVRATGVERVRGEFTGTLHNKNTGTNPLNSYKYQFVITKADELSSVASETPYPW